jgi:protein O-GlcNAc transferase
MSMEEKLAAGRAHHAAWRFAEAEQLYRAVLDVDHRNIGALRGLAFLCHQLGRYDVAVRWLVLLVETVPDDAGVWSNLATTHAILGDVDAAMVCCQRSLMLNPNHAGYHYNLATLLKDTGQLGEAIEEYRESLRLDPIGNPQAWNSLLYLIHFHPDYDPPRIYQEHLHWAEQNADRLNFAIAPHGNDRSPDRKLRIGYVSPLLRHHGMTFFLLGLLQNHDRERFEITCYSGTRRPDEETQLYREAADRWRDTAGVSHEDLAQQIRGDEIDILVDLNLHMADDRLEVFARKPAPVQVTYLGYPSTTGVKQIDWRITDAHLDPPGENDGLYVEKSD